MNNVLYKILQAAFVLVFSALLYNHLIDFNTKYFKYASSYLINKYHLEMFYYYMMFAESASIIIFLLNLWNGWIIKVYDIILSIYMIFLIVCLVCINEITNGCIECHFIAQAFFKDYSYTLYTIILLGIAYFFLFRPRLNQRVALRKNRKQGLG